MENNIPWYWKGMPVDPADIPEDVIGFCYMITDIANNMIYIGKKQLLSRTRSRIGVREKNATKTRKTFKTVTKDSGWLSYNSSCKPLQERIKTANPEEIRKEILEWAYSKKNLSWLELKYQILREVMTRPSYNECIGGKYWKKDIVKPIKTE